MKSTATKGVWEQDISDQVKVIYDTNVNTVRMVDERPNRSGFTIECPDGITTTLIERINRLLSATLRFENEKRQPDLQTA